VVEGELTDDELVREALRGKRSGSVGAFDTLFERYRKPIWQFFRRRVLDAGHAQELTQDTFVAVLEGLTRLESRTAFRAYLFGIAYNVLSAYRRKAAHRSTDPLDVDPPSNSPDPDAGLWVRHALTQLEANDREILLLREYDELSYQEIADLLRLPLNTVRSRLFRARTALKAALLPEVDSVRMQR
jgi:RNA polymerase sigma-70 factor (ECF subfamily)